MNYIGWNDFGAIMTCRRDRLPGDIEGHHLHKKTDYYDKKKVERFSHTIFATKNTDKVAGEITCDDGEDVEHFISKAFQHVHVSV